MEKQITFVRRDGNIDYELGPDGQTVILTYPDGAKQEIKMITKDEIENYDEICMGRYEICMGRYCSLPYAIFRTINLYKGDFLKEVCVYCIDKGGRFVFYKEKE